MSYLAFRLYPGQDLYNEITAAATKSGSASHAVVTCVGSLTKCQIRLAGATATNQQVSELSGPFEIVSLVGTIAGDRAHLHISVADSSGHVFGGHLMPGSIIDTTAEIVLVDLRPSHILMTREPDAATGFKELVVKTI